MNGPKRPRKSNRAPVHLSPRTRADEVRERVLAVLPTFRRFSDREVERERAIDFFHKVYISAGNMAALGIYADTLKTIDEPLYAALTAYQSRRGKSLFDLIPKNPDPNRTGRPPLIDTLSDAELADRMRLQAIKARLRMRRYYYRKKAAEGD